MSDISVPKDEIYRQILAALGKYVQEICENKELSIDISLASSFWIHPIWIDVFRLMDDKAIRLLLTPIPCATIAKSSKSNVYEERMYVAQFALIQIGILCGILTNPSRSFKLERKQLSKVEKALYKCLKSYQSKPNISIFLSWEQVFRDSCVVLKQICKYLNADNENWIYVENVFNNIPIEQLVLWLYYAEGQQSEAEITSILRKRLKKGARPSKQMLNDEYLLGLIQELKLSELYEWAIQYIEKMIARLRDYSDTEIIMTRIRIYKNYLFGFYYLSNDHEAVMNSDRLFYKGLLLLTQNDPHNAVGLFEKLMETDENAGVYINCLHGYCMLIENASYNEPQAIEKYWDQSARVIVKANQRVSSWNDEQRERYAAHLIWRHSIMYGDDKDYISHIESSFRIRINIENEAPYDRTVPSDSSPLSNPEDLRNHFVTESDADRYRTLASRGFGQKSMTHISILSDRIVRPEQAAEMMLLSMIINIIDALSGYSVQLFKENPKDNPKKKYEDRYTELFCIMFRLAYGSYWDMNCTDQSRRGSTGASLDRGGGVSEIDMTFYEKNTPIAFGEAMRQICTNTSEVLNHYGKLLASGNGNASVLFLITYYLGDHPDRFCSEYLKLFTSEKLQKREALGRVKVMKPLVPFSDPNTEYFDYELHGRYSAPRVFFSEIAFGSVRNTRIYHIIVDMKNAESRGIASESR